MSAPKPKLLFITPLTPMKGGIGSTLRAGNHLEVLADRYDETILLVDQWRKEGRLKFESDSQEWDSRTLVLPSSRTEAVFDDLTAPSVNKNIRLAASTLAPTLQVPPPARAIARALAPLGPGVRFDVIFAYRLRMARVAWALRRYLRSPGGVMLLDTDDIESEARRMFAEQFRHVSGRATYWSQRLGAERLHSAERRWFPRFDRVFVCSEKDRATLSREYPELGPDRFAVWPNAMRLPDAPLPWPAAPGAARNLVFVGNMTYMPNIDGMAWFCAEVLPALRRLAPGPFRVWIVGRDPPPDVAALATANPEVTVTGTVPRLEPYYARADVVIVPLRAGGGTRLKIIEAMGFGRPVVSTTIGAEGLEFAPGEEIVIADEAEDFARQCAALMTDSARARRLAEKGFARCHELYAVSRLKARLAPSFDAW